MWMGVAVIVTSGAIGVAWRHLRRREPEDVSVGELYVMGLVVHVAMLLWTFSLPGSLPLRVLSQISLPVMAIYPLGTALLGWLMVNHGARHRAEDALRTSEERLRLALEAGDLGLYDLDVQTGVAEVNDGYARMLGYDPGTFVETNDRWLERLHPEDRERVGRYYLAYVAGSIPEYRVDFRQKTQDGSWKWISSLGKIVERDTRGRPSRMLGTHIDITARKKAEEELRQRNQFIETILDNLPIGLAVNYDGFCQDFAERTQIPVEYVGIELPPLPDDLQITLYRVAQEALTNVAKHAAARQARVTLEQGAGAIALAVEDDGRGLGPSEGQSRSSDEGGIGLLGMQERLEVYGGALEIASEPGRGTRLVAHIPWEEDR
jgi:PAS domain S-box-containing protein